MKLLLDTHILLWLISASQRLPSAARGLLADTQNKLFFSVVSLWEITIKNSRGDPDFQVDARILRRELLGHGYQELVITGDHVVTVDTLPLLHKDPFDRLLIAQATIEGITLLTKDKLVASYPGPIQKI
jgi:PIN domain nuclease of toxin-antitoxin system